MGLKVIGPSTPDTGPSVVFDLSVFTAKFYDEFSYKIELFLHGFYLGV